MADSPCGPAPAPRKHPMPSCCTRGCCYPRMLESRLHPRRPLTGPRQPRPSRQADSMIKPGSVPGPRSVNRPSPDIPVTLTRDTDRHDGRNQGMWVVEARVRSIIRSAPGAWAPSNHPGLCTGMCLTFRHILRHSCTYEVISKTHSPSFASLGLPTVAGTEPLGRNGCSRK